MRAALAAGLIAATAAGVTPPVFVCYCYCDVTTPVDKNDQMTPAHQTDCNTANGCTHVGGTCDDFCKSKHLTCSVFEFGWSECVCDKAYAHLEHGVCPLKSESFHALGCAGHESSSMASSSSATLAPTESTPPTRFSVPTSLNQTFFCVIGSDSRTSGQYFEDMNDNQETSGDFLVDGVPRYLKCDDQYTTIQRQPATVLSRASWNIYYGNTRFYSSEQTQKTNTPPAHGYDANSLSSAVADSPEVQPGFCNPTVNACGGRIVMSNRSCAPGTFVNSINQSCVPCPPHTFSVSTDSTECVNCPLAKYQSNKGSSHCNSESHAPPHAASSENALLFSQEENNSVCANSNVTAWYHMRHGCSDWTKRYNATIKYSVDFDDEKGMLCGNGLCQSGALAVGAQHVSLSICVWFRSPEVPAYPQAVISTGRNGLFEIYVQRSLLDATAMDVVFKSPCRRWLVPSSTACTQISGDSSAAFHTFSKVPVGGGAQHACVVLDPAPTLQPFLNGKQGAALQTKQPPLLHPSPTGESVAAAAAAPIPLNFGALDFTSDYFRGSIGDVQVYHEALSRTDVLRLHICRNLTVQSPQPAPSSAPSSAPSLAPSLAPSSAPSSAAPSASPTVSATSSPTASPTDVPTASPSGFPNPAPTPSPSAAPSTVPTTSLTLLGDTPTSTPTSTPKTPTVLCTEDVAVVGGDVVEGGGNPLVSAPSTITTHEGCLSRCLQDHKCIGFVFKGGSVGTRNTSREIVTCGTLSFEVCDVLRANSVDISHLRFSTSGGRPPAATNTSHDQLCIVMDDRRTALLPNLASGLTTAKTCVGTPFWRRAKPSAESGWHFLSDPSCDLHNVSKGCSTAGEAYAMDKWCELNCKATPPFCPPSHCRCQGIDDTILERVEKLFNDEGNDPANTGTHKFSKVADLAMMVLLASVMLFL